MLLDTNQLAGDQNIIISRLLLGGCQEKIPMNIMIAAIVSQHRGAMLEIKSLRKIAKI